MKAYVVGSSALFFWRHNPQFIITLRPPMSNPLDDCPVSHEQLTSLKLASLGFGNTPIRLMVPSCKFRVQKSAYRYTVHSQAIPPLAFRQLNANVCLASPELCLLESCSAYSELRLMELAMELCGKYALAPETARGYISRDHQLTSVDSIRDFLNHVPHASGRRRLSKICDFIMDGSRSPMETREYLLACLPKRVGGYGLPAPTLNGRVELTPDERHTAGRSYFECDMIWENQKTVVEYDGHDDHESREDRARDALKRNVLIARGYRVFTITGKQIMSTQSFDAVIRNIARCLGYRLKSLPKDWETRRAVLRKELFASLAGRNQ